MKETDGKEIILEDISGQRFLFRTIPGEKSGELRRECIILDVKSPDQRFRRRRSHNPIIYIVPVVIVILILILAIALIIAGQKGSSHLSDEEIEEYKNVILSRPVPSESVYATDYEGELLEGGDIR